MKFSNKDGLIFLNEDIEVSLCDNNAFLNSKTQTLLIYGINEREFTPVVKSLKGVTLNKIVDIYKAGAVLSMTVQGKKRHYIITHREVDLSASQYIEGKINPLDYVFSIYVYERGTKPVKDLRYIYIEMGGDDEAEKIDNWNL